MTPIPEWQYDEMRQVGVDYGDPAEVEAYDARRREQPDFEAGNERILDRLSLEPGGRLLEIGTGTGWLAIAAARRGARVCAIDVSPAMLERARRNALEAGVDGIEFQQAGFLTYAHTGGQLDAAASVAALHHLPVFWKEIGLRRIAEAMKKGGRFYLSDAVYSFDPARHPEVFDKALREPAERGDAKGAQDLRALFSEEYCAPAWVMEGLLERAGFQIDEAEYPGELFANYLCTKRGA